MFLNRQTESWVFSDCPTNLQPRCSCGNPSPIVGIFKSKGDGNLGHAKIASSEAHTCRYAIGVLRWVGFIFDIVCTIDSKEVSMRTRRKHFLEDKHEKE
jgi:hypothetical protein